MKDELLNLKKLGIYNKNLIEKLKPNNINININNKIDIFEENPNDYSCENNNSDINSNNNNSEMNDLESNNSNNNTKESYNSRLMKLQIYREQLKSLNNILQSDPNNTTIIEMCCDINNNINIIKSNLTDYLFT